MRPLVVKVRLSGSLKYSAAPAALRAMVMKSFFLHPAMPAASVGTIVISDRK
jgi:hypothetical protein